MQTIKQMWEGFARQVIPRDAPAIQVQEMRRSFYAGCHAMLNGCADITEEAGTEDTAAAELESLAAELMAFRDAVATGRA